MSKVTALNAPESATGRRIGSQILTMFNTPSGRVPGMTTASVGRLALSALLASTLGACALSGPGAVKATPSTSAFAIVSPTPPNITPPTHLVRPGTITFLSDPPYPPPPSTDPATQHSVGVHTDIPQPIAA